MEEIKKRINWQLLRKIAGVVLIVLGFAALVTPLTPGAWLIVVGGQILGIEFLSHERLKAYYQKLRYWWWWRKHEKEKEKGEE